jgi:hypothetical protein
MKTICAMCKKEKECSREPSRSALIFGGFLNRSEYRCQACENKLIRRIEKMLEYKTVENVGDLDDRFN